MKYYIKTLYEYDDKNFNRDFLNMELVDEFGQVILDGDYYHDKIEEKIAGFFKCLNYLGKEFEKIETKSNEEDWL